MPDARGDSRLAQVAPRLDGQWERGGTAAGGADL